MKIHPSNILFSALFCLSCSAPTNPPPQAIDFRRSPTELIEAQMALQPDAGELGRQWLYGPGIGRSVANVGTTIAFPPYAIYLLGNAGLSLAGYEQWYITDALPNKPRQFVREFYDGITSVPGRVNALVAGEEFNSPES